MAKHRIRRWFQFGVLDLLILTTIVAVVADLYRGVQAKAVAARPRVAGVWAGDTFCMLLLPHGVCYSRGGWPTEDWQEEGLWTTEQVSSAADALVVKCGQRHFVVQQQPDSNEILLFEKKSSETLYQSWRFDGAKLGGKPEGAWRLVGPGVSSFWTLVYRSGELVDFRGPEGQRDSQKLNEMRKHCGLATLAEAESP
jgi:hypothetical protein